METTRRRLLKATGGGAVVALAGCLSEPGGDAAGDGDAEANLATQAAFFAVWDWTRAVTGDAAEVENTVAVGEMGHGWEPPGDIALEIAESDAFVYLDTPEFSWAQNVAEQVRDEGVPTIDTLEAVDSSSLLAWDADPAPTPDLDHDWDPDTVEIGDVDVFHQRSGNLVGFWHVDHWDGSLPEVGVDDSRTIDIVFYDDAGRVIPLGENHPFQVDAVVPDGIPGGESITIESTGDSLVFQGEEAGRTRVQIQLRADGDIVWASDDELNISVVEDASDEVGDIDADEIDDDAFYDPHVWVDPVLAQDQVSYIAEAFAELDPDNAEYYRDNATEYVAELEAVDQQFRDFVSEADTNVAVFAGHDAFQYIEHRYGFRLHSPQGVTPDAEPSPDDIAETLEIIEDNDIETILYDPFETDDHTPPPLAQQILNETDASDAKPLSPAEGTTAEWLEDDWGWVEQMTEMNIPSLRAALGAPEP